MHDCDFIPATYHQERSLRGAILLRASMLGTLVAIMAIWLVAHHHQVSSAQAMLSEVTSQHEQIALHQAKRAAMEQEESRLRARQDLLQRFEERPRLVVVLGEISRLLPEAVVMTDISVDGAGLGRYTHKPTAPLSKDGGTPSRGPSPQADSAAFPAPSPVDRASLRLTGVAPAAQEVLRFAAALEGCPLLRRVQLAAQEPAEWNGRRAERFEITCELAEQEHAR